MRAFLRASLTSTICFLTLFSCKKEQDSSSRSIPAEEITAIAERYGFKPDLDRKFSHLQLPAISPDSFISKMNLRISKTNQSLRSTGTITSDEIISSTTDIDFEGTFINYNPVSLNSFYTRTYKFENLRNALLPSVFTVGFQDISTYMPSWNLVTSEFAMEGLTGGPIATDEFQYSHLGGVISGNYSWDVSIGVLGNLIEATDIGGYVYIKNFGVQFTHNNGQLAYINIKRK